MTDNPPSCIICGHFILQNATPVDIRDNIHRTVMYDTTINSDIGTPIRAKLLITNTHPYSHGSTIYAIARTGPMIPYGYTVEVIRIISLISNPPLYWDVYRRCRLMAFGKILSCTVQNHRFLSITLRTVTDIAGCSWYWILR